MPSCRFCCASLRHSFVDLGVSPLCESYLSSDQLNQMEPSTRSTPTSVASVSWSSSRPTSAPTTSSANTPTSPHIRIALSTFLVYTERWSIALASVRRTRW